MTSKEDRERKLKEIQELAVGWGKIIAQEAFPNGPGLDVTLAEMEELAAAASHALVQGAVETMTGSQCKQFGQEAACPTCGRMCLLTSASRPMVVRGGEATLNEPVSVHGEMGKKEGEGCFAKWASNDWYPTWFLALVLGVGGAIPVGIGSPP